MSVFLSDNNTVNGTTPAFPPVLSPALLPGWPNCSVIPEALPPGAYATATDWIANGVPPATIVFGVFGNVLTVLVLSRSTKKLCSTTLYLITLAVSDTLFLLNSPLRQWIRHTWKYDIRSSHELVCKLTVWLTYGTLQYSSWLLVALTLERVVSVLWPHKVRVKCTGSTSKIVIALLFLFIFGLNSHWFYGLGTSDLSYYTVKTCMPLYKEYSYFFHHIWHWINFVVAFAAPFVILAIGNGIIIFQLTMRQRKRMSSLRSKGNLEFTREKKTITTVLILLSVVFFISQTPMSIYYIYIPYGIAEVNKLACDNYPEYTKQAEMIWFFYSVVNMLGHMNATLNFVLYVISGSRFRAEIKALLRCEGARAIGVFETTNSVRGWSKRSRVSSNLTTISKAE